MSDTYQIIGAIDRTELEEKTNAAVTAGAFPIGGPTVDKHDKWYQAVGPQQSGGGDLPAGSVAVADGDEVDVMVSNGVTDTFLIAGVAVTGSDAGVPYVNTRIPSTSTVLSQADNVNVADDTHNVTAAAVVTQGVLTKVQLPGTAAIVSDADAVQINNASNGTASVAAGVLTVNLAATDGIVSNGVAYTVNNSAASKTVNGTAAVSAGGLDSINLGVLVALIVDGDAVTVGGSTYTFTVDNGVITAIAVS